MTNSTLVMPASKWSCLVHTQPVVADPDALELDVTFTLMEGAAKNAGVAVAFDFAHWSTNNYLNST